MKTPIRGILHCHRHLGSRDLSMFVCRVTRIFMRSSCSDVFRKLLLFPIRFHSYHECLSYLSSQIENSNIQDASALMSLATVEHHITLGLWCPRPWDHSSKRLKGINALLLIPLLLEYNHLNPNQEPNPLYFPCFFLLSILFSILQPIVRTFPAKHKTLAWEVSQSKYSQVVWAELRIKNSRCTGNGTMLSRGF